MQWTGTIRVEYGGCDFLVTYTSGRKGRVTSIIYTDGEPIPLKTILADKIACVAMGPAYERQRRQSKKEEVA